MGLVVAVAGKGGVGKTTFSALLLRAFLRAGNGPVLMIDADPNANLNETLGVQPPKTIGDLMERTMAQKDGLPGGMAKAEFIEYGIEECLHEGKGFDLLAMGRPEGPGCYCFVNNVMREAVAKLKKRYPVVILDNEAGFEHLSRRTMRKADWLIVVSDPSLAALKAAGRALDLAKELRLDVKERGLVLNRAPESGGPTRRTAQEMGVKLLGRVPPDEALLAASVEGRSILDLGDDSAAARAVEEIAAREGMLESAKVPSR